MIAAAPTTADVWLLVGIGVLLVILMLLALAEMSLSRISRQRAEALQSAGHKRADLLVRLASEPTKWVNPLLLTVNAMQTVQAVLTGVVANRLFGALGVVIGVVLNVLVFFVLAEAVPKTYAVLHSVRGATATAPLVSLLSGFWPLRLASNLLIKVTNLFVKGKGLEQGPFLNEQEFLGLVEAAAKDSVIEVEEQSLIESVIEFGDTVVREIMTPRQDVMTVSENDTIRAALDMAVDQQFSRVPVLRVDDDDIDDVSGSVNTKDLMKLERAGRGDELVAGVMRPAHIVPETKSVAELMREMQHTKNHLAIVADEYGAFSGIVTLEDCLEELVGEIVDEHDDGDLNFRPQSNGDFLIEGGVSVADVNDRLQLALPTDDYDTIGGYVFGSIGRVPRLGEGPEVDGVRVLTEELDGRRITMVRVTKAAAHS
ncbi:MAG: hemolysin family protein [Ilumatobacteraceae bacterium]